MTESPPPTKRIVIACDGTFQSSVTEEDNIASNVTKLCRHVARTGVTPSGQEIPQIVYYDSGVGTGSLLSPEKQRQGATGDGLATNVIEAYNFIALNYCPGDEIFCFGFSRGAYTARAVAGLVTDIGVMEARHMPMFPSLYRAYKSNKEGVDFRKTKAWTQIVEGKKSARGGDSWEIRPHGKLTIPGSRKVKVVGVWDTVGSLGVPDGKFLDNSDKRAEYGFHNVKLNEHIEHAFHALALDERRKAFKPTVWCLPTLSEDFQGPPPDLLQVWFPGVHINIGGGSDDAIKEQIGDLEGMSNITFAWMLQCIAPYLRINEDTFRETITEYKEFLEDITFKHTLPPPSPKGWKEKTWAYIPYIPYVNPEPPAWQPPVRGWGLGRMIDSLTGMYNYPGGVDRTPGRCETEVWHDDWKEPHWVPIAGMGETNEYIHPVAAYRQKHYPKEVSIGLKGFNRNQSKDGSGFEWVHEGKDKDGKTVKTIVPEFSIKKAGKRPNLERLWMSADSLNGDEMTWLATVDKVNGKLANPDN